jgi:major membrane immunogen (membrane-anchored lipoprotein)
MEASAKKDHKKFKDVRINEEGLRDWFGKSRSKEGKPGWVNAVTGGTCASDEPGEGTPKCVSSAKRESMTKLQRLSATRRKKEADPGQQEKSGAAKPTYVSTDSKEKMKEEMNIQEVKDKPLEIAIGFKNQNGNDVKYYVKQDFIELLNENEIKQIKKIYNSLKKINTNPNPNPNSNKNKNKTKKISYCYQ